MMREDSSCTNDKNYFSINTVVQYTVLTVLQYYTTTVLDSIVIANGIDNICFLRSVELYVEFLDKLFQNRNRQLV